MAQNDTSIQHPVEETSKEILRFLKDGERKMEIGKFKNVTLLLGFTGSGKSTLTQFLTGNDEGLFAKETGADTGEFTIYDKNHQVCTGTIDSCTIIPTLYTDKETKSGFYDCPGFGDTRSVQHDISVTYFIKKVIDSVDSVKLLFTVSHHSVMEGMDRQSFMLLVKNVVKMVKNIDKFKNSIALITTKVDNKYIIKKRKVILVPDETVIANIANFLKKAKESLEAKIPQSNSDDHSFYTEAIKFISILLEKNGDDYTRIGLFRRPEEEGPLTGSTLLQSCKSRMQKILQSIQYVPKSAEDFGYTVSAESLNQMHDLIQNVNEKVSMTFTSMGRAIQDHYTLKESESKDIGELSKMLTFGGEVLFAIRENRKYYTSPNVLSYEIQTFAKSENIKMSMENFADVAHYDNFLGFIHQISGLSTSPVEWLNGIKMAEETVNNKIQWLKLLVNLQKRLFDYAAVSEIRGDPRSLNDLLRCIENIERSGSQSGQCGGLKDFLRQIMKNDLEMVYGNANVEPNVYEWKLLKQLLDFSVTSSCDEYFEGSTLIMKGQYVRFSDTIGKSCRRLIKSVKIFALKKVFIDESYRRIGDRVEVVIIAPYWEVMGSPVIALDGADGQDQLGKAQDGWSWNQNGYNGISGGNGGEGGMFWGMGQNCVNCQRLTVSANGGRGGAGQDGGDGADGRDFRTQYEGDQQGVLVTVFYNKKVTDTVHYGEPGGDGGNGGDGGLGGPKGIAKFVLFGGGSVPKTSAAQGRPGTGGAGGAPGKGGRSERRIHRVQTILVVPWWGDETIDLSPADDGSWGRNGAIHSFTSSPKGRFTNPSQTLSDYIALLKTKINTLLSDATTREFFQNLENAKIEDVKHHVGRRSAVHFNVTHDNVTTNNTSNVSPFTTKAFTFISAIMGIHHKFGRQSTDTEQPINSHNITSFQGIDAGYSPTLNEIPKIASSHSDVPAVGNGFGVSHVQSNLLLLDYIYRMSNRARGERRKNIYSSSYDSDYAQRSAYRAYVP